MSQWVGIKGGLEMCSVYNAAGLRTADLEQGWQPFSAKGQMVDILRFECHNSRGQVLDFVVRT